MDVWNYAVKRKNKETNETEGVCNRCNKALKCSKESTSSLIKHLRTQHGIIVSDDKKISEPSPKKSKTMLEFIQRQKLSEIVSDMATDGISIRAITRNQFIRNSISKEGYRLPANESDVMKLILSDFVEKKKVMLKEIKEKVEKGAKFSMTIDEYTTVRGRRYFGINLQDSLERKQFKTGIVRIFGSCPAEKMVESVQQHLNSFCLSFDNDIIAVTLDGAAVNKKFMRLTNIIAQFCLNHAIHLAVCDTLYKKPTNEDILSSEFDIIDDDETDDFDQAVDLQFMDGDIEENDIDFHELLKSSRKVVKFIKYSSVRNHVFQSKVKAKYGKEIELHLDIKTRWNSIACMIEPLLNTKLALFETFVELNATEIINKLSFPGLEELLKALNPVKLAVEVLSKEDSSLLTADTVLEFTLKKLDELDTEISRNLSHNLRTRINERWNHEVMNLLKSLNDSSITPSKATIDYAGKLSHRLYGANDCSVLTENNSTQQIEVGENLTLQEELQNFLASKENKLLTDKSDKFKWIKQEFTLFKNTGKRTENLQKLYEVLLCIKSTSTDVERTFSVCSSFCTKIRSRLSDASLNALVFLKSYYNKSKK